MYCKLVSSGPGVAAPGFGKRLGSAIGVVRPGRPGDGLVPGVLPGATVTVTNVGTNAQRMAVTDGEGRFSVPGLPPATYHIKVELQGFQTAELPNFVLRQGETARPAITLGVATISEGGHRHGRVAACCRRKAHRSDRSSARSRSKTCR